MHRIEDHIRLLIYEVDTAGLTSPVLERWPFERLRRPSFPLDPETAWAG